jgi:transposase
MSHKNKFRTYAQNQPFLIPPTWDELIPANHVVRSVNSVINQLDLEALFSKYPGGGAPGYHPRLLLKILVYGYLNNIYSTRKLEAATREHIHFLWLCGSEQPDHNTIARFRSGRLKGALKEVFTQVVLMMVESGQLDLKKAYIDGTKIEAQAGRYTFVWGKAIKTNKAKIATQLEELWNYAETLASEELKESRPTTFDPIDPKSVEATIDKINDALKGKEVSPKVKQKLNYAKKNWPKTTQKYNEQQAQMGERNSMSRTDPEATFMRMKEDHMQNGQLKPGYNVQISTENQAITQYTIHPNPTDTRTLAAHLDATETHLGRLPQEICADAGYGSEENYLMMLEKNITPYVKYNSFDQKQNSSRTTKYPFDPEHLYYNKELDCYYCPMGQKMYNVGQKTSTNPHGFRQIITSYKAQNCTGCPLRGVCHKAEGERIIGINYRLNNIKNQVDELLKSEKGLAHRSRRPIEAEAVFGRIKHNWGFRRFYLKGMQKVEVEIGLLSLAHNISKMIMRLENPLKNQWEHLIKTILGTVKTKIAF